MDTAHLLTRCRTGDSLALEELVETYQPLLHRLALSVLDNPAEAEDAVQDAFIAIIDSLDAYRGEAALTTWVYAVALNVCRKRLRKRIARKRLMQTLQWLLRLPEEANADPEEAAVHNEYDAALRRAVRALDEKHRLPILLHYAHGLTVIEIAQILGIPQGTVLSRLHTARKRLKGILVGKVETQ